MTNRFLGAALALASLVSPTIAAAQVADRAGAPSGTAPLQSPCVVQANGTCAAVKDSVPLPVVITSRPTGTNAMQVQGTNAAGATDIANPVTVAGVDNGGNTSRLATSGNGAGRGNLYVEIAGQSAVNSGIPDSGAPFKTGGYASGGIPGTVANGQRVNDWNALTGAKVFSPGSATLGYGLNLTASPSLVQDANGSARPLGVIGMVTDGANGVFQRDANTASGTSGTGLLGVGNLGFDGSVWRALRVDGNGYGVFSGSSINGGAMGGSFLTTGGVGSTSVPVTVANGQGARTWLGVNGQTIIATGSNGGVTFSNVWSSANGIGDTQNNARPLIVAPVVASSGNAAVVQLDANAASGSSGTGLLGVGNLGWDGAAWQRQRLTAGGGMLVADQDGIAVPFTPGGAINAILFSTPTTGYAGVSYQANGSWSGTVSIEGSNDASADCQTGGTWFGLTSMNLNGGNPSTTINGNTGLFIPAATTCARARVSGYNSGSFTGVAVLRSLTPLPSTTQVNNYKAQFNSEVNNGAVAASAAKINYTTRDLGGGTVNYSRFTCYFDPGVASTGALGHIEGSPDNSNWTPLLPPVDLSTVTPVTRESRVFYRYNRCAFTNGTAAQTGLYVASQYGD